MANILNIELEDIVSYKLCTQSKRILSISNDSSTLLNDAVKVLAILDRLFINYTMDENYNFQLYPQLSYRGNVENG